MTRPLLVLAPRLLTVAGVLIMAVLSLRVAGFLPAWAARWPATTAPGPAGTRAAAAEACMQRGAAIIGAARRAAGLPTDAGSMADDGALVGSEMTPLVTTLGSLEAKRLAGSPAWARVMTRELAQAGVGRGSVVAASFSGSFPGINLATMCAVHELGGRLIAVTSVTASTWGATDPGFTWPEMEVRLVEAGLFAPGSVAVSIGGGDDRGQDLDPEGHELAVRIGRTSARTLGARFLEPASFTDAVRQRLDALDTAAGHSPVAVFVNVGGAQASLGRSAAILEARSGWLTQVPQAVRDGGGLLGVMAGRGTPVLHMLNIRELAVRWDVR